MIKGATILGLGFGLGRMGTEPVIPVAKRVAIFGAGACLGYTIAMNSIEPQGEIKKEAAEFIRSMKAVLIDMHLDIKKEMSDAKKASEAEKKQKDDVVEGTVAEEQPPTPEPSDKTDDAGQQGETP